MPRQPPRPSDADVPPWDELAAGSRTDPEATSAAAPDADVPPDGDQEDLAEGYDASFAEQRSSRWPLIVGAVLSLLVLAVAGLYFWNSRPPSPAPDLSSAMPSVAPPPPSPPAPEPDMPELVLPPLGASDPFIREVIERLSDHPRLAAWVAPEDLVRRFVVTVDNLSRGESPRVHLRHLDPERGFAVDDRGSEVVIDERSFRRYDRAVQVFTSLDTARGVELYRHLEPLFEEAYGELGNPYKFEEALVAAIDRLLEVEIPDGGLRVERRVDNYRFADPALESLSPAAKHLLRMGPRNAREVQAKLRAIRTALALTAEQEEAP